MHQVIDICGKNECKQQTDALIWCGMSACGSGLVRLMHQTGTWVKCDYLMLFALATSRLPYVSLALRHPGLTVTFYTSPDVSGVTVP